MLGYVIDISPQIIYNKKQLAKSAEYPHKVRNLYELGRKRY